MFFWRKGVDFFRGRGGICYPSVTNYSPCYTYACFQMFLDNFIVLFCFLLDVMQHCRLILNVFSPPKWKVFGLADLLMFCRSSGCTVGLFIIVHFLFDVPASFLYELLFLYSTFLSYFADVLLLFWNPLNFLVYIRSWLRTTLSHLFLLLKIWCNFFNSTYNYLDFHIGSLI